MLTNIDIVRDYYIAIDHGDLAKAGQILADDFRRVGSSVETMGKAGSLAAMGQLRAAMPDLKHSLSNLYAEGTVVTVTVQAGGRLTAPLDLAGLGLGIEEGLVPASGRMIIFLPDNLKYTLVNGKIMLEENVTPPKVFNGVTGFLQAIGYAGQ